MKFLNKLFRKFGYVKADQFRKRSAIMAAITNNLTHSWAASNQTADAELRPALSIVRARSRNLFLNNDYAKKFVNMTKVNILGAEGITFQSKVKLDAGKYYHEANNAFEYHWQEWGKKRNSPDVTGKYSLKDIQELALETVVRDGEVFIRKVRGYENEYRYAVQLIEADRVDENHNENLQNGNKIRMGIEMNQWGKPIAYHVLTAYPSDVVTYPLKKERILAEDIIHLFLPYRVTQNRGLPWMHTSMLRLNMLNGYEEAELVASRIASAKMGLIKTERPDQYFGDDMDENQNKIIDVEPGTFDYLPAGADMTMFDPQHPNTAFSAFVKQLLRGIASGLNVSYNSLASDLESVNYSSIRSGTLEERDNWRRLQRWFSESFCEPLYADWLYMLLLTKKVPYAISDFKKYHKAKWHGRTWDWVDPLRDQKANLAGLSAGLITRTELAAERGQDFEEIVEQLKYELEVMKANGLDMLVLTPSPAIRTAHDEEDMEEITTGGNNGKRN